MQCKEIWLSTGNEAVSTQDSKYLSYVFSISSFATCVY